MQLFSLFIAPLLGPVVVGCRVWWRRRRVTRRFTITFTRARASLRWRLIILDKSLLLSPLFSHPHRARVLWSSQGSDRVAAASRRTAHRSSNSNMFLLHRSECGSQAENVKRKNENYVRLRFKDIAHIQQQRRRWTHFFRFRVSSVGCWLREKSID